MSNARLRALEALKRKRAPTPAGPLFAPEEEESAAPASVYDRVAVLFPLPLPEPFDYRARKELGLTPGMHVIAPIGTRLVRGVVWSVGDGAGAENLKEIEEVLPGPAVPERSRKFLDWAARYVVRPPGDLLRMVVRSEEALLDAPTYAVLSPSGTVPPKLTDARNRVLIEAAKEAVIPSELARRAGVTGAVVKGLVDSGALRRVLVSEDPPFEAPDLTRAGKPLSDDQARGGGRALYFCARGRLSCLAARWRHRLGQDGSVFGGGGGSSRR